MENSIIAVLNIFVSLSCHLLLLVTGMDWFPCAIDEHKHDFYIGGSTDTNVAPCGGSWRH